MEERCQWQGPQHYTEEERARRQETLDKEAAEERQRIESYLKKEQVTHASFEVSISKNQLAQIPLLPVEKELEDDNEKEQKIPSQQEDLRRMLDRFLQLPDRLSFQAGITLIVGENGEGKSTFARALFIALKYPNASTSVVPSRIHTYEEVWMAQSGLAPVIAQTLTITDMKSGLFRQFIDCPETYGERTQTEAQHWTDAMLANKPFVPWNTHRSHRQTVDHFQFSNLTLPKSPAIYFFDEPETGMSYGRHKNIAEEIKGWTTANSSIIVPTNSVVLHESNLPRIDLQYPERGVHLPSDFSS